MAIYGYARMHKTLLVPWPAPTLASSSEQEGAKLPLYDIATRGNWSVQEPCSLACYSLTSDRICGDADSQRKGYESSSRGVAVPQAKARLIYPENLRCCRAIRNPVSGYLYVSKPVKSEFPFAPLHRLFHLSHGASDLYV